MGILVGYVVEVVVVFVGGYCLVVYVVVGV